MKPVTIAEASEKLSELFDAALRGEEVIITKDDSIVKLISNSLSSIILLRQGVQRVWFG